jgi:hypothetical protein
MLISKRFCETLYHWFSDFFQVFRLGQVLPFGMARAVLKEVKFHGYRIPTNAVVVPNLDSVLMNTKTFKEPEAFKPERFISKTTGQVSCPAQFIPFFFGESVLKEHRFHSCTYLETVRTSLPTKKGLWVAS